MIFKTPLRESQIQDSMRSALDEEKLNVIREKIKNESAERQSADAQINQDINQLWTNLSDEVNRRAQDDLALQTDIQNKIANESSARSTRDVQFARELADEKSARENSIKQLQEGYITADSALLDLLTTEINTEVSNLQTAIDAEKKSREDSDSALREDLNSAIQSEQSARQSAINSLRADLTAETSTRKSQTDSLSSAISKEVTDRSTAINNLQTNFNAAISAEASQRSADKVELQSSITSAVTNIEKNITDFTPSTETKDGKRGLVPAPPKSSELLLLTNSGWSEAVEVGIYVSLPTQSGELRYNGAVQYPVWNNFDAAKFKVEGTTSATDAKTYTMTLTPAGSYAWADNGKRESRNVTWQILPKIITIPTAAVTSFDYSGNEISLNVNNPNSDGTNQTGTIKATSAGSYTVTYKLKSANYIFSDGSTTDKNISWKINKKTFAKPTGTPTTFTFNKSAQGPSISNFDSNWMTKSGSDTAVAAGSYSITIALKDKNNSAWSDNSTDNVTISYLVEVLKLAKPTAAATTFDYDGKAKSLSVSNFNSNYMSQLGSISEINAGDFSATYVLADTVNCKWQDNSTANVVIGWKINRQKLSAAQSTFSQSGTLTYNGNSQNVSITNFNSTYHSLSSETSATNAGNYTAQVTPTSNYCFSDGSTSSKSVSWTINKKSFNKPAASKVEFEYTGETFNLDVANYDSNWMNRTGTVAASAEGNYSVTYALKDKNNLQWQDKSTADVTLNWLIKTNKFDKPTLSTSSFEYSGSSITPAIKNFNADYMSKSGSDTAIAAGSYSVTISLKDKNNTSWSSGDTDDVTLTWTITRKKLTAAQSTFSQKGTLTYSGSSQNVSINNYDSTYHSLSSTTSAVDAGTYTAQITPTSNYTFSDGSTAAKNVSWKISPLAIAKPTAAKTSFEYDGAVKTLSLTNYNSNRMTKSGTDSASVKGTYTVTFSLNSTNFVWEGNSSADYMIDWSIGAKSIAKPQVSGSTSFTYDGNAKTLNVTGYDSTTMIQSGTISATNAGNYSAVYELRDKDNYVWQGGGTDNVSLTWTIERAKLSAANSNPTAPENYLAGDMNHCFLPIPYRATGYCLYDPATPNLSKANLMKNYVMGTDANSVEFYGEYADGTKPVRKSTGTVGAVIGDDVGTYYICCVPDDNHAWSDGSTDAKKLPWRILPTILPKPIIPETLTFEYDGKTKSVLASNLNTVLYRAFSRNGYANGVYGHSVNTLADYVDVKGTSSATNAGKYQVIYSLKDKSGKNYSFDDGSVENIAKTSGICSVEDIVVNWEITKPDGYTKPTLSVSSVEWSGGNVSPTISGFDSNTMTKSGTDTAIAIGTYNITISLKDKANNSWSDGSTGDVTLTWYVTRKKLTAAQSTFSQSGTITYDGTSKTPTISGYNNSYHELSSQTSATAAGTYTIKITPLSTYCFNDGSTSAQSVNWKIEPLKLTKPTLTNTTFTYDGNEHSPTINDFNSTYENQSGTANSTNAGTFTVTYSLKNTTNTVWQDDSTDDVQRTWTINKATPTLTLSTDSVTLESAANARVYPTFTGDGSLTATSADTDTVTVKISNDVTTGQKNIIVITASKKYKKSTTVTVTLNATTNYKAVSKSITATSSWVPSFANCYDWDTISDIVADNAHTANVHTNWNAGDSRTETIAIKDGGVDVYNKAVKIMILGVNHCDLDSEHGKVSSRIDCAILNSNFNPGNHAALQPIAFYNESASSKYRKFFCFDGDNCEMFNNYEFRFSSCAASTSYLPKGIIAVAKYGVVGVNVSRQGAQKFWLMTYDEVAGTSEGNGVYTEQYDYFKNGNPYTSTQNHWTRDRSTTSGDHHYFKTDNGGEITLYNYRGTMNYLNALGVIPCFRIGS